METKWVYFLHHPANSNVCYLFAEVIEKEIKSLFYFNKDQT